MSPSGRPFLSIVVPAYNEQERLARSLPLIDAYIQRQKIETEVIVVDDGSIDGTSRVASEWLRGRRGLVLRHAENRGKGFAVRRGILAASGRFVLMTDADLATPIEEHGKLAAAVLDHELDVAIGSRGLPESIVEGDEGPMRKIRTRVFNYLMRWMMGLSFRDTQCGFKLIDRERTRPLIERMVVDRFAFDVELLFLCMRFGLRVREIPVVWRHDPDSRVGLLVDPMRMLVDVARVRWRYRRGGYLPTG